MLAALFLLIVATFFLRDRTHRSLSSQVVDQPSTLNPISKSIDEDDKNADPATLPMLEEENSPSAGKGGYSSPYKAHHNHLSPNTISPISTFVEHIDAARAGIVDSMYHIHRLLDYCKFKPDPGESIDVFLERKRYLVEDMHNVAGLPDAVAQQLVSVLDECEPIFRAASNDDFHTPWKQLAVDGGHPVAIMETTAATNPSLSQADITLLRHQTDSLRNALRRTISRCH